MIEVDPVDIGLGLVNSTDRYELDFAVFEN